MELGQRALWRVTDGLRLGGHGSARTSCVCWKGGFGFKPRKAALEGKDYIGTPGGWWKGSLSQGLGQQEVPILKLVPWSRVPLLPVAARSTPVSPKWA